jgi:hypothetical protein
MLQLFGERTPFEQFHFLDLGQRMKCIDVVTQCEANYLLVRAISTAAKSCKDALQILTRSESLFKVLFETYTLVKAYPNSPFLSPGECVALSSM